MVARPFFFFFFFFLEIHPIFVPNSREKTSIFARDFGQELFFFRFRMDFLDNRFWNCRRRHSRCRYHRPSCGERSTFCYDPSLDKKGLPRNVCQNLNLAAWANVQERWERLTRLERWQRSGTCQTLLTFHFIYIYIFISQINSFSLWLLIHSFTEYLT